MSMISACLKVANKEISKSDAPHYKIGAVAFKKGRVIGSGRNHFYKTHPNARCKTRRIHAEHDLVIKTGEDLKKAKILVARMSADGSYTMARPCGFCFERLVGAGVKSIFYTNWEGKVVKDERLN